MFGGFVVQAQFCPEPFQVDFKYFSEFSSSIYETSYLLRILPKSLGEQPGAIYSEFGDITLFSSCSRLILDRKLS